MRKIIKSLFAAALLIRCLFAPQSSCGGDDLVDGLILTALYGPGPAVAGCAAIGAGYAAWGAAELLVPLEWMKPGTISEFLEKMPPPSTSGDGSIWPIGLGFSFPDAQFPGEAASVALADIGALTIRHANIYGIQAGGVIAKVTDTCAGISVGGFSAAANTVYGIQVGGLLSSCRSDIYGLQVAGYANDTLGLCAGMQTGVVNMADGLCGAQIGFTNCARDASGMQIGVINVAKNMQGVQIGLINFITDNGMLPASPLVNMGF